ncbi:MAG: hypothetical protein RLP44_14905 [Aggregatilineales bacterium]
MAVTAGWDDIVDYIYIVRCEDTWTWAEFDAAIRTSFAELAESDKTIDFMMCFNDNLPKGNAIYHLTVAGKQPPNFRHTVMVNQSGRFLEIVVKSADKARGWEGPTFVKTIEDGRDYLLKQSNS